MTGATVTLPAGLEETLLRTAGALMQDGEVRKLAEFAAEVHPEHEIVEVGSWAGGSAAWLCAGSAHGKGAHITCIDIWEDWIDPPPDQDPWRGDDALAKFASLVDWSRLTALKANSLNVAPMWVKPIGMLFIDALHTYEGCRDDYLAWHEHIVPGGILAVHDYMHEPRGEFWWTEGPTRAVDEVIEPSGLWEPLGVVGAMWTARRKSAS